MLRASYKHLLVAESLIQELGGVYAKYSIPKDDFIQEYVGEVVSQDEAERRVPFVQEEFKLPFQLK